MEDRVAQATGDLLAGVEELDSVAVEDGMGRRRGVIDGRAAVEMVLDGFLAAAGDDEHGLDAGVEQLLGDELNDGRHTEREHLLGLRAGGGQEAHTMTGSGDERAENRSGGRGVAAGLRHGAPQKADGGRGLVTGSQARRQRPATVLASPRELQTTRCPSPRASPTRLRSSYVGRARLGRGGGAEFPVRLPR